MRSCEYQDKSRKEINTTDVSAHSCRAVGSNMQTRLLHQSFYLFFVDYNHHKYLGREFNNTHCPIQFFAVVYSKEINPNYRTSLPLNIIRIVFEEALSPSCYKPSLIRIKVVILICLPVFSVQV